MFCIIYFLFPRVWPIVIWKLIIILTWDVMVETVVFEHWMYDQKLIFGRVICLFHSTWCNVIWDLMAFCFLKLPRLALEWNDIGNRHCALSVQILLGYIVWCVLVWFLHVGVSRTNRLYHMTTWRAGGRFYYICHGDIYLENRGFLRNAWFHNMVLSGVTSCCS